MKNKMKDIDYYMSLNYPFTVELFEEDTNLRFGIQIPDLPGIWADGETIEEAYADLVETKRIWFETHLERGLDIPEPISEKDYSGKFIVRLDPQLHMAISSQAKTNKISMNRFVKSLLEKHVGHSDVIAQVKAVGKMITKQITDLRTEISSLRYRMESLESAFSEMPDVVWITPEFQVGEWQGKGDLTQFLQVSPVTLDREDSPAADVVISAGGKNFIALQCIK